MEANTRVQVEHPITEILYGIDLVKEQIKLAAGETLSFEHNMPFNGHSVECRINAEDARTFVPSPGKIEFLVFPGGQGIRLDSAAYQGWSIPPHYDSLLAKIISHAPTRKEALKKMETALEKTIVVGVKTNIPLHLKVLGNSQFNQGKYHIQFLEKLLASEK